MCALEMRDDFLAACEAFGVGGKGGADSDANDLAVVKNAGGVVLPERGFGVQEAAWAPFAVAERIDERLLGRVGRVILLLELGGEIGEILGGFVEDDRGFGVDAEL